ncbi:hypothetical protein V8F33_008546 [Rhypophila sp. PSN 637]
MIYPTLLITLAAAVTAIDIRMRRGNTNCEWGGGGWVACNNANPDFCCYTGEGMGTIWLAAIPNGWNVEAKVWYNTACNNRHPILQGGGRNGPNVCERAGSDTFRGGSYSFRSKKRDAATDASKGCQQADTFILADGVTQYNITGMASDGINELFDLSDSFTAPEDMPQHIKDLQLTQL